MISLATSLFSPLAGRQALAASNTVYALSALKVKYGTTGNDILNGTPGNDDLRGNAGNDKLWGFAGDDTLLGEAGDDYLYAGDGNDQLNGGTGIDSLYGNSGRDTVHGYGDGDLLNGGTSKDLVTFSLASAGMTIDLTTGQARITGDDAIAQFQRFVPGDYEILKAGKQKYSLLLNAEGGIDPVDQAMMQALVKKMAKRLADRNEAVIAITGAIDIVADRDKAYIIRNGHPQMAKVSGTGCMLSALIAAYCGANPEQLLDATAAAVCLRCSIPQRPFLLTRSLERPSL
mgnify:CR=1 FL=1